jgi:hypothetical protein
MQTPLIAFLSGSGPDGSGRYLANVLRMSDDALEYHHDYIQWLFPLPEPSRAVPGSPVLSKTEIEAIRGNPSIRKNLLAAVSRMRAFYENNDHWLTGFDHNHLRISRIIRSLDILVGKDEAESFLKIVMLRNESAGNPVNRRSVAFWQEAATSPQ